jgi:predicted O-methyltransferase YrrM
VDEPSPTWAAVDAYVGQELGFEDDVLRAALARADAAGLPQIQVSAAQGRLLQLLARIHGASRVLEIGTLGGYSTICLARGLTGDRHVTTLEIEPTHAEVARENIAEAGLGEVVDVRLGPAGASLDDLVAEGAEPYDLAFIDADKPSNTRYLEAALRLVRPGGVIVVDNVVRQGRIADAGDTDPTVEGSRAVIAQVGSDDRLTATVLQTVGAKGYDGMLVIRIES